MTAIILKEKVWRVAKRWRNLRQIKDCPTTAFEAGHRTTVQNPGAEKLLAQHYRPLESRNEP